MHTWLTVAALTKRLGRAPATIRLWRDTYAAHVPERIDEAGHQTYPLEILEAIAAMRARNLTPREITAELERRSGSAADTKPVSREDAILGELRAIREALADLPAIRAALERLAER